MHGIIIENGDIVVSNGSMLVAEVNSQIAEVMMLLSPGSLKETPLLGINITNMLSGNVDPMLVGQIKTQLKTQHITTKVVTVDETGVNIEI